MTPNKRKADGYEAYDGIEYSLLMEAACRHCGQRWGDHRFDDLCPDQPNVGWAAQGNCFEIYLPEET